MSVVDEEDGSFFAGLFRRQKTIELEIPTEPIQSRPSPPKDSKRIVCFRLDSDLDHRLSRALRSMSCSRSQFIRNAIERMLKQDGEERLKAAHSAIRWD
jgi:hypothetical protein